MKISKTAVLVLGGIFATLGLGLMVVNAAEKTLTMDLKNAVQHFKTVRLITTSDNSGVELNRIDGPLVEISGANNFIITTGGTEETQINQILNVRNSSILGGKGNKINNGGSSRHYNVILGGEGNLMDGSNLNFYNVILGGKGNQIHNSRQSVILGGEGNIINNNSSFDTAIGNKNTLGGSYSVAVGYKNTLSSSNSAAVGSNGTVGGTRSFLWTNDTLSVGEGDVFVVNGENGMVVNANKAHSFAKLTVGGSLVIGTKDISAGEGGMIKVLNGTNGRKCFCSHNGSGRNSLHGGGSCAPICNGTQKNPKCAATADVTCNGKVFNVENGCEIGSVVAGTGAFFIDNGNYIHWACESENGNVTTSLNPSVDCKQKIPDGQCESSKPEAQCSLVKYECIKGDPVEPYEEDDDNWYWYCRYGAESLVRCPASKSKQSAACLNPKNAGYPSLVDGTWSWTNGDKFLQTNADGTWTPLASDPSVKTQYDPDGSKVCGFKCNGTKTLIDGKCQELACSNTLVVNPNGGQVKLGGVTKTSLSSLSKACGSGVSLTATDWNSVRTGGCEMTFDGNGGTPTVSARTGVITETTKHSFVSWTKNPTSDCGNYDGLNYMFPNSNGKTCTMTANWLTGTTTVSTGTIKLPDAKKSDYVLSGWYTSPIGGTFVGLSGADYTPTACTTLYAQWKTAGKYECVNYEEYRKCTDGITGTPASGPNTNEDYWTCGDKLCHTCKSGLNHKIYDGEDLCLACNNCAKNGFPLCFPISFDPNCSETGYVNL